MIGQRDGDEAGAEIDVIHHGTKGKGRGLPVSLGTEVTHHLAECLDMPREHVVTVHLETERDGGARGEYVMKSEICENVVW